MKPEIANKTVIFFLHKEWYVVPLANPSDFADHPINHKRDSDANQRYPDNVNIFVLCSKNDIDNFSPDSLHTCYVDYITVKPSGIYREIINVHKETGRLPKTDSFTRIGPSKEAYEILNKEFIK